MSARRSTAGVFACLLAFGMAASGCRSGASARTTTLRVLSWAPELELYLEQEIASDWSAGRPGVRVEVESVVENFGEKLVTSIVSGAPPDVFLLDAPDVPALVERGLVLDLAPYAARAGYDPARVFPNVRAVFERGERLFALPKGFTPMVVYCNAQVFERYRVPLPAADGWTWEQFLETARRLTRDEDGDGRPEVYGVDFPRQLYEWIPFVWSAGGDVLDPTGARTAGYLDSPASVAAFRFLTDLVLVQKVAPPVQFLETGDAARGSRFFSGKQAMRISGHWTLPQMLKYVERGRLEIAVAPIPHRSGASSRTVLYASGWAVPANVRQRRLAVELAAHMAGERAQRMRMAKRLEIPALAAVAAENAAADATGVERAFLREAQQARMTWGASVMDFHRIEQMSFDVMDRRLLRGEELALVATQTARAIDVALAR